jgi:hypothetical protein
MMSRIMFSMKIGNYRIPIHFKLEKDSADAPCRWDAGTVISGSRALAREFMKTHMNGRRRKVLFGRCPACGQRVKLTLSISNGEGAVYFKSEPYSPKERVAGPEFIGTAIEACKGRKGDPIGFIRGKVFFLEPIDRETRIIPGCTYLIKGVLFEGERFGKLAVEEL